MMQIITKTNTIMTTLNSFKFKWLLMPLVLIFLSIESVYGQGTEGFESFASSSTSYSSRSWTGNNGVSSWAATNARNDYSITGSYGLTFKKDNSCTITMKLTTAQKNAGMGTLSFNYKYPVNTSDAGNTISVTLNGNTHSTTLSNPGNTGTVRSGSITINETLSSTTVTINIGSGGRICIDDLSWTAAASCSANPTIGTASLNGSFL